VIGDGWDDLFDDSGEGPSVERDDRDAGPSPEAVPEPIEGPDPDEEGLFGANRQFLKAWQYWDGMPEYVMNNLEPFAQITVKFRSQEDLDAFAALLGRDLRTVEPRGIWYPVKVVAHYWDKRYRDASADEEAS
jgi:hypothetical protein